MSVQSDRLNASIQALSLKTDQVLSALASAQSSDSEAELSAAADQVDSITAKLTAVVPDAPAA